MTPYHTDPWLTVYQGDCREVMAAMEPESIHCVVTSPPYWGLRDYGTATWLDGDEGCDHLGPPKASPRSTLKNDGRPIERVGQNNYERAATVPFAHTCRKCGAIRQDSQLGLEPTPEEYVTNMVAVFREVRRVLRADGTVWLNLGDSYAGTLERGESYSSGVKRKWQHGSSRDTADENWQENGRVRTGLKPKDLCGIPWRVAFALQADGWYLRSAITWCKANPMPESVTDRPTNATEMVFLLSKSARYFYDSDAVRETAKYQPGDRTDVDRGGFGGKWADQPGKEAFRSISGGRNLRNYWLFPTQPYGGVRVQRVGDGGTDRRVSRDCPVHGDQRQPDSTVGYGERSDVSDPGHSQRTDPRLEPTPLVERAPTGRQLDAGFAPDSSGSRDPASGSAATPRSSRTRRTAPAPETSPRENVDETLGRRTERKPQADVPDAIADHRPASSTAEGSAVGDSPTGPSAGTPDRSACTCTYWESISHFAVFPEALVEPCVKAGTSERGVCPECGAPWVRWRTNEGKPDGYTNRQPKDRPANVPPKNITTGWRPTCDHSRCSHCARLGPDDEGTSDVSGVPAGVLRAPQPPEPLLLQDMREPRDGEEQTDDEGFRSIISGVHPGVSARSSDGAPQRVPTPASAGDVGSDRSAPEPRRDSRSHQRDQGRQPAGEPAHPHEAGSRLPADAAGQTNRVSALRREDHRLGTCPSCGEGLEPLAPVPARVLDMFAGSGTTGRVAQRLGRRAVLIDLSGEYLTQAMRRNSGFTLPLGL